MDNAIFTVNFLLQVGFINCLTIPYNLTMKAITRAIISTSLKKQEYILMLVMVAD